MKLVVISAIWRRPEVVAIMLDNLRQQKARLAGEVDLEVVVAGSEGRTSRNLVEKYDARYIEHLNQPLGAKFNAALEAAREFQPDAVLVLGSDNVANAALFRTWAGALAEDYEYLGILDSTMYQPATNRLVHWHGYQSAQRRGETAGSGRCYSRKLLDRVDWRLWDEWPQSLDWSVTCRLKALQPRAKHIRMTEANIHHLGVKTSGTICPFRALLDNPENKITALDPSLLVEWFGEIGTRILQLGPTI